jgi:hypothetical protein
MLIKMHCLLNGMTLPAPGHPMMTCLAGYTSQSLPAHPLCPCYTPQAHENATCIHIACHIINDMSIDNSHVPCSGPLWNMNHGSEMMEYTPKHTRMTPKHLPDTQPTPARSPDPHLHQNAQHNCHIIISNSPVPHSTPPKTMSCSSEMTRSPLASCHHCS